MNIDGTTKLVAVIGNPLSHTLSPLMHNCYFQALKLNHIYVPLEVEEKELSIAIQGLWSLGFIGANVTIPYKEKIMDYLVEISEEARMIGAVNTLVRSAEGFKGENTDGKGFLNSLKENNWFPQGKKVVLLGAGGAARAVGTTLALNGAREVTIVNRTLPKAKEIAHKISNQIGIKASVTGWDDLSLKDAVPNADIIINTTPLGMKPNLNEAPPLNTEWLRPGQLVADLIYNPLTTKFLEDAKRQGADTVNGLGMLIHQGIFSFELWTGKKPPVEGVMELLEKHLLKVQSECHVPSVQ